MEEGHYWSHPRDTEHYHEGIDPVAFRQQSAKDFIGFAMGRGFPGNQ